MNNASLPSLPQNLSRSSSAKQKSGKQVLSSQKSGTNTPVVNTPGTVVNNNNTININNNNNATENGNAIHIIPLATEGGHGEAVINNVINIVIQSSAPNATIGGGVNNNTIVNIVNNVPSNNTINIRQEEYPPPNT